MSSLQFAPPEIYSSSPYRVNDKPFALEILTCITLHPNIRFKEISPVSYDKSMTCLVFVTDRTIEEPCSNRSHVSGNVALCLVPIVVGSLKNTRLTNCK